MSLNFSPFIVLETFLAAGVLFLFIWRKMVARNEDDNIHILHGGAAVPQQETLARKLDVIDKWGKILTVVTVAFGLLVGLAYAYDSFVKASGL